jgi:acetylornithine deacetylase/succinyl-diaminopimelate desuccinylase-like protein
VEVADAEATIVDHLHAAAPWNARVTVEIQASGAPFSASTDGPAYQAMGEAMYESYGTVPTTLGQGGSIPLATVLADTFPDAEVLLMGVEEPQSLIHAPNESVDPAELSAMALAEALFLRDYRGRTP